MVKGRMILTTGLWVGLMWLAIGCGSGSSSSLPILGTSQVVDGDTLYHTIPEFSFINQDSAKITQADLEGKIYVTDFFFTSCPTICPKMKQQMLRLYQRFKDDNEVMLLSHSIDPSYDTPTVLREYAKGLGISSDKWLLVTGEQKDIYLIADEYLVSVAEDESVPGGFIHGGHFILVDKSRRIRGYYDGTKEKEVDQLMSDIELLISEYTAS